MTPSFIFNFKIGAFWRIALFCALGVILALALNRLLVGALRRSTVGEYGFRNAMANGTLASDVVIIGSSRAMVHFDCDVITDALGASCINLGLDGTRTTQQVPMLALYLSHSAPPKILVVEVDVGSLETQHTALHPELAIAYAEVPTFYDEQVRLDLRFWAVRHVPLYGFASSDLNAAWDAIIFLAGGTSSGGQQQRRRGYTPVERPFDSTFAEFKREHPQGVVTPIDALGERAVDRLIEMGQHRGARVVLVYPPALDESHRYLINEPVIIADLKRIAAGRRASFLDYSDDDLGRDSTLFYNSQHMNVRGATQFSHHFASRLVELERRSR